MNARPVLAAILAASLLLAACGQRGPLYLPDPARQTDDLKRAR